ncbi:hypothetical protein C5E04_19145 [Pectobacterium parmentieri]|nr:hypothetical protein C5E04_19145 [Pectobacterium parmentieri]
MKYQILIKISIICLTHHAAIIINETLQKTQKQVNQKKLNIIEKIKYIVFILNHSCWNVLYSTILKISNKKEKNHLLH